MIVVTAMPVVNAKARTITTKIVFMTPDLANRQSEHGRTDGAFCDRNHATLFFSWIGGALSAISHIVISVPGLFQGAGDGRNRSQNFAAGSHPNRSIRCGLR
jgi:hypothetical protein